MAKLLVVDDEKDILTALEDLLTSLGYQVIAVSSGTAALEALQAIDNGLPDLIVSDVVMPQITGLDLIEKVRAQSAWEHIPFLLISARTTLQLDKQIDKLENSLFLRKPFDPVQFCDIIEKIIQIGCTPEDW